MPLGRFLKILLGALFALAVVFVVAVQYSGIQPASDIQNFAAYGQIAKEYLDYACTLVMRAIEWFRGLSHNDWLAGFTGILAISTIALWRATKRLVRGAEETAERQLRAYVLVEKVTIFDFAQDKQPYIHVVMRNTGQTPAFNVHYTATAGMIPFPPTSPFVFNWPSKKSYFVIGPRAATTITIRPSLVLSADDIADVLSKKIAMYAYGRIEYEDAFGREQWAEFRVLHGGNFGPSENGLMLDDEDSGNNASR